MKLVKPPPITEAEFLAQVLELAKGLGWMIYHARPGMTSRINKQGKPIWVTPMQGTPGFPDLVLCNGWRIIFAELKTEYGKVTQPQSCWLKNLMGVRNIIAAQLSQQKTMPVEVYVWRPSQLQEIAEILK